jgi:hypothetical protein
MALHLDPLNLAVFSTCDFGGQLSTEGVTASVARCHMAGMANNQFLEEQIMKTFRLIVAIVALTAFAFSGVALAADTYYVAKDKAGKMVVVNKKPADVKMVVKGPFKSMEEAKAALAAAQKAPK